MTTDAPIWLDLSVIQTDNLLIYGISRLLMVLYDRWKIRTFIYDTEG